MASIGAQTAGYGVILWGPTLFVLQLGVTPAYAAYLFIYITAAGIVGRVAFSVMSESDRPAHRRHAVRLRRRGLRRRGGHCCTTSSSAASRCSGCSSCIGDFFYDGGFAIIGPYMAEVWPTRLRTTGMGSAYGFGGLGKIIGPLGLALIVGSSNVVKPEVTVAAIPASFLFLAAWLVVCGLRLPAVRLRDAAALDHGAG